MIISRCCKEAVYFFDGVEGCAFYVCTDCDRACDTLDATTFDREVEYDARGTAEAC